jgi:hypothetical protein
MECNSEEIGGQIVESSNGKIVIRTPVNNGKEWQDWLQDFSIKTELGLDRTQYVPLMQQSYIQEGLFLSIFML